ncbi:hypothetical protein WR25_19947 [Diploscapter pachys]|uniref:Galectin n=1 Tax=Diploscapter pachys TaxID=2018661 RepID=A0A2A2L1W5_9BILA|nr:hypothetical protein WR25_19947 [Diploscapter pachys]
MIFTVQLLSVVVVVSVFFCWSRTSAKLIDDKKLVKQFNSTLEISAERVLNFDERNLRTGDVIRLAGEWYYEHKIWNNHEIEINMMSDADNYILFHLKTNIKEDKLIADQMDGKDRWLKLMNVSMPFTIDRNNAFDIEILLRGDCMQVNINDDPTLCLKNKITYPQLGFNNISRIRIAKSNVHYRIIGWYEENLDRSSTTPKVASVGKTTATSSFSRNTTTDSDFVSNVPEDGFIPDFPDESDQNLPPPKMTLISIALIFIWHFKVCICRL